MKSGPEGRTWTKALLREGSTAETIGASLFLSLLFVAPISETLNNVLIVLLFLWWLSTRPVVRELRAAPPHLLIIVLFGAAPLVSLATSTVGEPSDRLVDVTGAVKFALLLLAIWSISSRARASIDVEPVTVCLVAGAVIALVEAFVTWMGSFEGYPVLKALVGANGSALYMSLVLVSAIALSWSPKLPLSILGGTVILISFCYSIMTASITAFIVSVCVLFLAAAMSAFTGRWKVFLGAIAALAILSGAVLSATIAHDYWETFTREAAANLYGDTPGSYRIEIFNTAAEVYDRNLWFGAGYRQFGKATSVEIVADELEREGRSYEGERSRFYHVNHGHNVWTQVLVERGLVGVALLLSFFLATAFRICRNVLDLCRRREGGLEPVRLAFISSGVWIMLFVGGIGNSTFHTEHGMAALVLLVWSLARFEAFRARTHG